jgi:hypothetical protein
MKYVTVLVPDCFGNGCMVCDGCDKNPRDQMMPSVERVLRRKPKKGANIKT